MQSYVIAIAVLAFYIIWQTRNSNFWKIGFLRKATSKEMEGRRYKELFEHSSDAIFVVEVLHPGKFRFESLNPVAMRGIDPEGHGLEGRLLDEISQLSCNRERSHILQNLIHQLECAVKTCMPVQYEGPFSHELNMEYAISDVRLFPMVDDDGISHVLCFAHDITSRKLYELELLKRSKLEERLSGFIASAPGVFYSYQHGSDGGNTLPFISDGINELFGLQPHDVAQSIPPLHLLTHLEDMPQIIHAIARSAAELSPLTTEFRTRHPDKGELWIESRAKPVKKQDGSIVWHGFMHDITERKNMEEALRSSRQNLAEAQRIGRMGSFELDIQSAALSLSDEIYRIFETNSVPFCSHPEAFLNTIHPNDRESVKKVRSESLERNTPYNIDYCLLFPDERIKYVRECCEVHFDADGEPHHVHGTVQDITSLKITEQILQDTQKKLRELIVSRELLREEERKHIAWEMHEELGQLLAAMKMRMSGIRAQLPKHVPVLTDDSRVLVDLIDKAIHMVHDIVSQLRPTVLFHGTVAALEWLVAEFNKNSGIECELCIDELEGSLISDELMTLVFRMAQDALENVMRHTSVTHVAVSWASNHNIHCIKIQHDGDEISIAGLSGDESLCYFGLDERVRAFGGTLQLSSTLKQGTVIEACFPGK